MEQFCAQCGQPTRKQCGLCERCYQKQYAEQHKEKRKQQKKEYYCKNKVSLQKKVAEYQAQNVEKIRKRTLDYYYAHKAQCRAAQRKLDKTPKRKFDKGKKSAEERNLEWSLDFNTYCDLINQPCHYCNEDLSQYGGVSLDRKLNNVGYRLDNVLPCCGKCNNIRNNFLTVEEMEVAMSAIMEFRRQQNGQL